MNGFFRRATTPQKTLTSEWTGCRYNRPNEPKEKFGQQWVPKAPIVEPKVNRKLINYATSEANEAELANRAHLRIYHPALQRGSFFARLSVEMETGQLSETLLKHFVRIDPLDISRVTSEFAVN